MPSAYEEDGRLFAALLDVAWHTLYRPTIWIRGTHVNWHAVTAGPYEFNIDNEQERAALLEWARALRYQHPGDPPPIPAQV